MLRVYADRDSWIERINRVNPFKPSCSFGIC